jgi:hypothetical protein
MRACPACAGENDDSAIFCATCGDIIEWESSGRPIVADRPGASRFQVPQPAPPVATPAPAPAPTPPSTPPPDLPPPAVEAPPLPAPEAPLRPPVAPAAEAVAAPAAGAAFAPPAMPEVPDAPAGAEPVASEPEVLAPPVSPAPEPAPKPAPEPAPEPAPVDSERVRRLVARSRLVPAAEPEQPAVAPTTPAARAPAPEPARVAPSEPASGSLAAAIQIAERSGRTDLASRLRANREQIRRTGVTVAVVGEFKKGKSSLVNALVNAELCPSDPVDATVVPIAVSHGDELVVTVELKGRPAEQVDLAQVAVQGSEAGNQANDLGVTRIEIAVPRRLLASGLVFIDTPGVGGLESAAGALNLAMLEQVDGVLFVSDCSQELTAPEVTFLAAARERCPHIVCVMTKLDLHLAAGVLAEHNRRHLAAAGLQDIQVLTVSSVLHLLSLAQGDARLEQESGFGALFDTIHATIWEPARTRGLADAGQQLADLADHLAIPLEAAQRAKDSPQAAQQTIARLTEARDRVRQFRSASSRWQQRLAEGMRTLARLVEGRVDVDDPSDDLVFEAWVHKAAIEAVVGHYELIVERSNVVAEEIGQYFATLDRQASFQVEAAMPTDLLATLHVNREQRLLKDGVVRRLVTTGQGYSSGLVLFSSVVGVVSALPWIPLLALPFAGLMAKRAFSDDKDRRRSAHGQELKRLATRYLDEIGFIVHKDSRDTVRRIQRDIREHYSVRAEQLEVTLQHAMASAEQAQAATLPATAARQSEDRSTIRDVASVAQRLVAGAAIAS